MKILFLYDFPLWGSGSGTYLRNIVKELIKDHEVGIVAPEERRFLEDKIKQYKVEPPQTPVFIGHPELKGAKRYSELSAREITEIYKSYLDATLDAISNFKPDVLHVNHLSLISWVARYIYALTGVKYIVTVHGSGLSNILENKKYLPLCKDAIEHAKAITAVSKHTKDRFFESFDENLVTRSRIIPGGVNINQFPKEKDTSHIEEKYDLKGKKVVFFAGRLSSEKGVTYLVKAAEDIDAEVFLAGEGPKKQDLEEIIRKRNLDNVHLLGYLETNEIIPFYYRADVFVAPSTVDEAFGLSILEAMAASTPVVVTAKGAIPMLVKNKKTGYFVNERNCSDIAEKCNKLLDNDKLRKRMGERARKRAEERFTWEKVTKKLETLYEIVTGQYSNGNGKNKSLTQMKKAELIKKAIDEGIEFFSSVVTRKDLIEKLRKKKEEKEG
ncbi:MAG: glycosyltransferase family 4 protein [Minisyncoccales bacterium]